MTSQTTGTPADHAALTSAQGWCFQYGIKVYAPGGDFRPVEDLLADIAAHEEALKPVRHVPKPKIEARVHFRSSPTRTTSRGKRIGDGSIYDSVEIRCSNGITVNVFADGTVETKQGPAQETIPRVGFHLTNTPPW